MMEGFFRFSIFSLNYIIIQFNSITLFYFQSHLCRIISQRNKRNRHYRKNGKSKGVSTEKSDSKKQRLEMKNINVTKKGLLPDEKFDSMLMQIRAEYTKAVPNKKFIAALLEKTRNIRARWNEENIIEKTVPGCRQIRKLSFIRCENLYLTNKMYFWIMTD